MLNGPALHNRDISIQKSLAPPQRTSARNMLPGGEALNAWNQPQFNSPNGDLITGATFARISSTRSLRLLQISTRIEWQRGRSDRQHPTEKILSTPVFKRLTFSIIV